MFIQPIMSLTPREGKRKSVLMTGILFTPDGALRVRLRDLSSTGVRVFAESKMLSDCDALFRKGPLYVAARVVWSRDKEAGLRFYRELSAEELASVFH